MDLSTSIEKLNRVGKTLSQHLNRLGIETVRDLLLYFPFRYEDYSKVSLIRNVKKGDQVSIKARIELIANKRSFKKRTFITEAVVADESGQIRIVWFGQPFITKLLKVGEEVYFSGKVSLDRLGLQMKGPSYEKIRKSSGSIKTAHTARIVPIYHITKGVTQKQIRFLVSQVIDLVESIAEWIPNEIRKKAKVVELPEAVKNIHFPSSVRSLQSADRRIKFGELYILQLRAELIRQSLKQYKARKIDFSEEPIKSFVDSLPFKLTDDQRKAAWGIIKDLETDEPMNRLLEGDVGAGKTVVAAIALYNTVLSGCQAVMMAPTEILANQHFVALKEYLGANAVIGLLTRSQKRIGDEEIKGRKKILEKIKNGEVNIIVGTHALLSDDVEFDNLAFAVVDEQHRFGVDQRKALRKKSGDENTSLHYLSMTATPIPRSFALTLYGDLDLSVIKEKPKGRKPITTQLVEPKKRGVAYENIRSEVKKGKQVFVICPLIESKQDDELIVRQDEKKSVMEEYDKLSNIVFPELSIGYLHGKMKGKEKEETMAKFKKGDFNILVSTSVVEVGVDVPNATIMMIEGAERFGLAQLHQFRGRVGRSSHKSYCFVFYESSSIDAEKRLDFFSKINDGFELAEYDLERRGPGEVYGTHQSGMMHFKRASMRDVELIKLARSCAKGIDFKKYPKIQEKVQEWEKTVHFE